jgi:hypothetical protein
LASLLCLISPALDSKNSQILFHTIKPHNWRSSFFPSSLYLGECFFPSWVPFIGSMPGVPATLVFHPLLLWLFHSLHVVGIVYNCICYASYHFHCSGRMFSLVFFQIFFVNAQLSLP